MRWRSIPAWVDGEVVEADGQVVRRLRRMMSN